VRCPPREISCLKYFSTRQGRQAPSPELMGLACRVVWRLRVKSKYTHEHQPTQFPLDDLWS
jgi:hypothetical protein